ncbi:MAG: 2-oxoacid:acceptor oxidoreductase subunit alpha [Ignavibacteria bacterium]|nr:2-oxoacid:acceptor oxidoreductase subunit alpha [Bacteroidota bacterium]MSQ46619.1 2-oxoacid:acceptor oxidoreductase subunit alpha [Ignavibacteria bacterium]
MEKIEKKLKEVTIRFAGDSGDGMQITGTQFTNTTAMMGNDLSTFPDYPAEIRAPQGTLFGVSGFQIHFGSTEINTPGDNCDVLVAMNAAALKVNLRGLIPGGAIIANTDGFNDKNLKLAEYATNPLKDDSLSSYKVYQTDITKLTTLALLDMNLSNKIVERTKNFFALGMMYWMYNRSIDQSIKWVQNKFKSKPEIVEANIRVLKAGWNFAETTEIFTVKYTVEPASLPKGKYRNITGNSATAIGLVAAAEKANLNLFLGTYPITPASDILHDLSMYKEFNVRTFQAEDEIAAITSTIGASFGGSLAVTTTSGPGIALKTEAIGLAVMVELPLIIINVQRGGPSTGLPTKTEQADLLQAVYGRNGEAPVPVVAASTPGDCFYTVFEAARIALKYMTPVFCLTDGYLANGSEPWMIPDANSLPDISTKFRKDPNNYLPYLRNAETLAREWAIPGTPGLEHRIGGLEKEDKTGNINYEPENHEKMVHLRAEKIERIANDIPLAKPEGDASGDLLVLGWGGTYGAIRTAVSTHRKNGMSVSHLHLRHLNPFPKNLGEVLYNFKKILIPEINLGQLSKLIRAKYLVPALSYNKVQGLPFTARELEIKIESILSGDLK